MHKLLIFLAGCLLLVSCTHKPGESGWIETVGIVTESAKIDDSTYAFTLTYSVTKSTAYNKNNELISGELSHHIFGIDKLAITGQKIKLRYRVDDPMDHQLLEEIKYK